MQQTDMALSRLPGGGGDDDGDDDSDDVGEEEELMEGEEDDDDSEETDDEDGEMVVLDPDHPLMKRFQKALKSHLDKQNEKVTLELRELLEAVKNRRQEREGVGVELYGVQQELARYQMMLEQNHDSLSGMKQDRNQTEQYLEEVRDQYAGNTTLVKDEKKKGSSLQSEVESLNLRLFYLDTAKEDVRGDIAVMKRAAEKAESVVVKAETAKQKQDLFVDRLVERVDKLREEIAMYDAQLMAQSEETKAAKEALSDAHMEIEALGLEKKQLFQQWNSSLIGMRRRDEAHAAMMEALNQQQQRILSLDTEIEGYKKSISSEQEGNEKWTMVLSKTEQDIATSRKLMAQCLAKHEALKNEYATYTRMLHETEQALARANTDKTLRLNEVNTLRKQIEREYLEKVRLEDDILEKYRSQTTMDKASQYTDKLTKKLRTRTKDLDSQVAQAENDISKVTLEVSHTRTRGERLQQMLKEVDEEIKQKNAVIERSEVEMTRRNAVIERKQGIIDQFNKKLEHMIGQAGGVELGPLEIQMNSLQKSIDAEHQEIAEMQQMWLRDQSELVRLSKEKDQESSGVDTLKKQLTILSQKKLRIEAEINNVTCDTSDIRRTIRNMQNDMLKLNVLLHKERGTEHELHKGTLLKESDFIGSLKQAERESIELQATLEGTTEEKERLLNSLVESERQIMLWEKKTQLARETRAAVDSEVGQGEMKAMRAEIHRMQVRYSQLMKQQERMIQEMEKAVSRRDTIVTRGDAQTKVSKKTVTKGTFQRQLNELKKKIKQTINDANASDLEIRELREQQQELSGQLEERQLNVQQLQGSADTLDGDVDRLVEQKQKNMADLVALQQKTKNYQQVKDKKYTRLCKSDTAVDNELQKQVDRMQAMLAIADRLTQEYPHAQPALRKVALAYGSRAQP